MATVDLVGGGAHPLRKKALQIGMHSAVVLAHDVPARLRFPRGSSKFLVEQVGLGRLGRPNEFLFLLWQISGEALVPSAQPDTSIDDFDVGEDVGLRELGLLRLRRFVGVRSERADVNQPDNAIVGSGASDDASAIGVTDEDNRAADPSQCSSTASTSPLRLSRLFCAAITRIPRLEGWGSVY